MADAEMGVEKLYAIFGVFDLDPAAATPPNVRAAVHYKSPTSALTAYRKVNLEEVVGQPWV